MNKRFVLLLTLIALAMATDTTFPYTIEAEDCTGAGKVLTSFYKKIWGDYSGKGFVYLTDQTISFEVTVPEEATYQITAKVAQVLCGDGRQETISVNGVDYKYTIPYYSTWTDFSFGEYTLSKGVNTIKFKPNYSYYLIDKITVSKSEVTLSDPNATAEAKSLMAYLKSVNGKHIISGQQEINGGGNNGNYELEFDFIYKTTGKYPAIRGFEFMNYNPLYGWEDGTTDRIIEWVNKRGGIATASWHINVPIDFNSYTLGNKVDWSQCTYGLTSSFKTADCIVEGTKENKYWDLAIKDLAEQLTKLQDANVPLIFRPLHEAEGNGGADGSGAWFWWGKAGAATYVKIWKYLYKKLTEEYGLHNLIWEQNLYTWSSASSEWYSGDDYVDFVGYDKYNTIYHRNDGKTSGPNLDSEVGIFNGLVDIVNSKKMVAMAECDSIPSLSNLVSDKATWLYFLTWYGDYILSSNNNDPSDLKKLYTSDYCITLDELPSLANFKA